MENYCKWWDELGKVAKVVLSIFGIFLFLYRLFKVIMEKAENTDRLVYLILNVVPIIGTVIIVIDIVWMAMDRPVALCFADWSNPGAPKEDNVVEAESQEVKEEPAEEKPAE